MQRGAYDINQQSPDQFHTTNQNSYQRYASEKKSGGAVPAGIDQKILDAYLNQTKSQKSLYKVKKPTQ
jgi:hypothetical protein